MISSSPSSTESTSAAGSIYRDTKLTGWENLKTNSVDDIALQSRNIGDVAAPLLRTPFIVVSVATEQAERMNVNKTILQKKLCFSFMVRPPLPITALGCKALHFLGDFNKKNYRAISAKV